MGFKAFYISILLATLYNIPTVRTRTTINLASRHDSNPESEFETINQNLSSPQKTVNDEPFQPSFFYGVPEQQNETNLTRKRPAVRQVDSARQFEIDEPGKLARSSEESKVSNRSLEVNNSSQSANIEQKLESPTTNKLPRSYGNYDFKSESNHHLHQPHGTPDVKFPVDQPHHYGNYNSDHLRHQHGTQDHPAGIHSHNNNQHGYYDLQQYANQAYSPNSLPVDIKEEHYHYEDPYYSPNLNLKPHKHLEAHLNLGLPTIKSGIRGAENTFIGPAFSRALKFWIPSALLLTGASVFFPKRIHVPTDEQPLNNNYRPKRNANFGPRDLEVIPSVMLHQEHDITDHNQNGNQPNEKSPAYRTSYSRRGRFLSNYKGPTHGEKTIIPEFTPIPKSNESNEKLIENSNLFNAYKLNRNQGSSDSRVKFANPQHKNQQITVVKEGDLQNNSKSQKFTSETPAGRKVIIVLRTKNRPGNSNSTNHIEKDSESEKQELTAESNHTPTIANPSQDISDIGNSSPIDQNAIVQTALKTIQDQQHPKEYDLTSNGPVVGLLSSVLKYEYESEDCQKRALCELAIRGTNTKATRFETFMWSLATLVPDAFTYLYDLDDVFRAIRDKNCASFICAKPNLDIQM